MWEMKLDEEHCSKNWGNSTYAPASPMHRFIEQFNIKKYERGGTRLDKITLQNDLELYLDTNLLLNSFLEFSQNNNITNFEQAHALWKLSKE